jgi:hypothetical protein
MTKRLKRKWLRQVKRLLCCGFRHTGKAMWQVYQCWWRTCRDTNVFFVGSNITCFTFYIHLWPTTYLLTLPHKGTAGIAQSVYWLDYGLDIRGTMICFRKGKGFKSCLQRPYRLWAPPNCLSNGYQLVVPWGEEALYTVSKSRMHRNVPAPRCISWRSA